MESIDPTRPVWAEPRPVLPLAGFSIAPSLLLLTTGIVRTRYLRSAPAKLRLGGLGVVKLTTLIVYLGLQYALTVLSGHRNNRSQALGFVSAALALIVGHFALVLSWLEQGRAVRPSTILISYFSVTPVFDVFWLRTAWQCHFGRPYMAVSVASFLVKVVIAALESLDKKKYAKYKDESTSPDDWAGLWNRISLFWIYPTMILGYRSKLSITDISPLGEELTTGVLDQQFNPSVKRWTGKHSLIWELFWSLRWPLLYPVLPYLLHIAFTYSKPLMIKAVLEYLDRDNSLPASEDTETILILAMFVAFSGYAVSHSLYSNMQDRLGIKASGMLTSAIYIKVTELPSAETEQAATTLMEVDVHRICIGLHLLHSLWSNLLQVGIGLYLLQRELGFAAIAPVAIVGLCVVAAIFMNGRLLKHQDRWMDGIQDRIKSISDMLSSIKGIRMAGLSELSYSAITSLRAGELDAALWFRLWLTGLVFIAFAPGLLIPVACFAVYLLSATKGTFDITRAFVSIALISTIAEPLQSLFGLLPGFTEAYNCLRRVERFLLVASRQEPRTFIRTDGYAVNSANIRLPSSDADYEYTVNSTAKQMGNNMAIIENGEFYWSFDNPVLKHVNIEIPAAKVTLVTGSVASGKTTFCKTLLGEVPQSQGSVYLDASSSYIGYCDQVPYLTNGTIRENIVAYGTYDSAWYNSVIGTVTLNADFETFPDGDQTLIGSNGVALSNGQRQRVALARAVYSRSKMLVLDDVMSGMDTITKKRIISNLFGTDGLVRQFKTTVVLVGHDKNLLQISDRVIFFKKGKAPESREYDAERDKGAFYEDETVNADDNDDGSKTVATQDGTETKTTFSDTQKAYVRASWPVYKFYFDAVGWLNVSLTLVYGALYALFSSFPTLWLNWWTAEVRRDDGFYLTVYGILQTCAISALVLTIRQTLIINVSTSGVVLHKRLLSAVIHAPMPFLSKLDNGAIVNRFSQDFNYIDDEMPRGVMNLVLSVLSAFAHLALVAAPSGWMVLSFPVMLWIWYWIQKFYLRTSQQLRPMSLEYRSPIFSHFLDTARGVATIRAFGWTQSSIETQYKLTDTSQKLTYTRELIGTWLGMTQALTGLAMAVTLTALALKGGLDPGLTAVALVNLTQFNDIIGGLMWGWTTMESAITAVSRVKEFCQDTPREDVGSVFVDKFTEDNWPSAGAINCQNLVASYGPDAADMALKGVNLQIKPGEKVGVCGRSGSGKSTLLASLFRMVDIRSGEISIDDIDIRNLHLSSLRSRINAIPQDPFFLPGSFCANLDPYGQSSEAEMKEALVRVRLWDKVEQSGGLDAQLKASEMSQGEKQLFSMARAILRRDCKIVVLDEVSSSLDFEMEKLIVQVLKEEFEGHTIVAIAHRLETIIDFDRVAVFSEGRVIEYDSPETLLGNPESAFSKLCAAG